MIAFMLIVSLLLALATANTTANAITCAKGAHLVVARGSLEPQGPGAMGVLAEEILKLIPGSDMEALVYPALYADSEGFPSSLSQPAYITDNIAAIIAMGDPSLTEGQPFLVGTSEGSGIFPRKLPIGCNAIASKTVSICDKGDPYCEASGKDLSVHLSYIKNYGEFTVGHVVKAWKSRN
ncbi:hypothetical protein J7337_001563 [Fusarium musae]|uniref:Cutinase n=1 Tax=Fusarium musae TaxID=1042133 RepID=A0A9P8DUU5_9HYPO|nr:hypothetical protein J7337_001563 [Fusarium musae]KAG9508006.1 hypothetical protein J7337_001563 [Fusarium musae]